MVSVPAIYALTPAFSGAFGGVAICGRMAPRVFVGASRAPSGMSGFEVKRSNILGLRNGAPAYGETWAPERIARVVEFLAECARGKPHTPPLRLGGAVVSMVSEIPRARGWMLAYSTSLAVATALHLLDGTLDAGLVGDAFDAHGTLLPQWEQTLQLAWCLVAHQAKVIPSAYPLCAALQGGTHLSVVTQSPDEILPSEYEGRRIGCESREAIAWMPMKMRAQCQRIDQLPTYPRGENPSRGYVDVAIVRTSDTEVDTAEVHDRIVARAGRTEATVADLRSKIDGAATVTDGRPDTVKDILNGLFRASAVES
ncbi:MAG: hypothetical protein ACOYN0_18780 [Phycisphaerales bacterium]